MSIVYNHVGPFQRAVRVTHILEDVDFPGHEWHVTADGDGVRIHARFMAPCNVNGGEPSEQRTRRWGIRPEASDSEIVGTAFKCILTSVEHETREQFKYRGRAVFGPHFDVEQLWNIAH